MKLFLRKSQCNKSDEIRKLMLDPLWQLVTVEFTTSTEPFLETPTGPLHDPTAIVDHLIAQTQMSPSLIKQLRNAQQAAVKAYKHAIKTGQLIASDEVTSSRRDICAQCPFNQTRWRIQRCTKCGCSISAKTATLTESCPLDKW